MEHKHTHTHTHTHTHMTREKNGGEEEGERKSLREEGIERREIKRKEGEVGKDGKKEREKER